MSLWKIGLDLDGQVEDALKSHNADKRTLILVGHRRYLNRVKCSTGASEISVTSPPRANLASLYLKQEITLILY